MTSRATGPAAGWPIRAYLASLTAVFVLVAGAALAYWYVRARTDAQRAALADAVVGARAAAAALSSEGTQVQVAVDGLAASQAITAAFAGQQCSLSFSGGRIALIDRRGVEVCASDRTGVGGPAYASSPWFRSALSQPAVVGPVRDPVSHRDVLVMAAPVVGRGTVAGMVDLESLGTQLGSAYGGVRRLQFLVSDNGTVLTSSADPRQWIGTALAGTRFAQPSGSSLRPGLDGVERYYGHAAVSGFGWQVYAGVSHSAAVAAANSLFEDQLEIVLGGLVVFFIAVGVISRRVTAPMRRLSDAVAALGQSTHDSRGLDLPLDQLERRGPSEVIHLADQFGEMSAAVRRHIDGLEAAHRALADSERRLQLFLDRAPALISVTDLHGRLLIVNERQAAFCGRSESELIGRRSAELLPAELAAAADTVRLTPTVGHLPASQQAVLVDGSGVEGVYNLVTFPVSDAQGDVYGVGSIATDITAEAMARAERADLEAQLEQARRLESLGQLAGGVAHDFNNLLGVILNYTRFSLDSVSEPSTVEDWATVRDDLHQVVAAGERAARLVSQLLTFARRDVIQLEVVDLNDVVEGVQELLSRTLREDIHLHVELDRAPCPIVADTGQVEQILVNLVVNARDAMPGGGQVRIDTATIDVSADDPTSTGLTPGRYVRLRVTDNGCGMPTEVLERIYEPFYSTKQPGVGTGLGLATVYGIVMQRGGRVDASSEPDHGTTFSILLPAAADDSLATSPVVTAPTAEAGHGETVLVVEDEGALRDVIKRMLTRHGYRVITAADGPEALEKLSDAAPEVDIVLADVVLPHMLGTDLAANLAQRQPGLRVVLMSGYAQPVLLAQQALGSPSVLLEKPFTEAALLSVIDTVIRSGLCPPDEPT